jgi:hypothetical protein
MRTIMKQLQIPLHGIIGLMLCLTVTSFNQSMQKFTLTKPFNPRFALTEITWPANHGDASVCLWENDKLSAYCFTFDDNNVGNVPWLLAKADTYGFKFTWFIITGGIDNSNYTSQGTWSLWRQVFAKGHAVESHSMAHGNTVLFQSLYGRTDYWNDWYDYYYMPRKRIIDSIPGDKCYTMATPGGTQVENTDSAWSYFISLRDGSCFPDNANSIDFSRTNSCSAWDTSHLWSTFDKTTLVWNYNFYRGWNSLIKHWVSDQDTATYIGYFNFIKAHQNQLWVAKYPDVVRYNMEYATHKLTKLEATTTLVRYTLSDSMADSIYNYPLSVKIRLNSDWQSVQAKQNGTVVPCSLITYNSNLYALIKTVPDKGEIRLTKNATAIRNIIPSVHFRNQQNQTRTYDLRGRAITSLVDKSHGIYFIANTKHEILNKQCVLKNIP